MPNPNPALLPSPALFDVTTIAKAPVEGTIERVALDHLELAPNPRTRHLRRRHRVARRTADAHRPADPVHRPPPQPQPADGAALRRTAPLLAAKASHELAGTDGFEGLAPVRSLIVLLLDHEPTPDEIRRIQAQANQREELTLVDQQQQFADCWHARAGLRRRRPDRRGLRRPRHLPQARAQPPPPAHPPRPDPRTRRRAPHRRAALGHDGQPARRHARHRTRAHRGRRQADHHHRPARQGAARPRRVRAPHRRRGRAHLRRPDRRRRTARRRRADRARPRAPHRPPTASSSRRSSAANRARSTASSTRSPPAPRPGRSRSGSPPRSATAPATAATRTSTTADRTSPPASGSSTPRS